MKWEKIINNEILQFDGYYISYNPDTQKDHLGMTGIANMMASLVDPDLSFKDGEETALYNEKTSVWYILEGDFRKEYEACNSFEECLEVYKNNIDKRSNWSSDDLG